MKYQDCVEAMQAADAAPDDDIVGAPRLADANINPATGFATDYLNHFNEAIMLLEMLSSCTECRDEFLAWQPMSYSAHFQTSRFRGRDMAIAAYEAADPNLRSCLDALAGTMTAVLEATRAALRADMPPEAAAELSERAAAWLKPLVARAGAVINGEADASLPLSPQAIVDEMMRK